MSSVSFSHSLSPSRMLSRCSSQPVGPPPLPQCPSPSLLPVSSMVYGPERPPHIWRWARTFPMMTEACFSGPEQVERSAQPLAAEDQGQRKVPAGSKHKRMLCLEPAAEGQPPPTTTSTLSSAANTSGAASAPHPHKDSGPVARTRPNILGGNRPKRRIQPVRCLKDHRAEEDNLREADKPTEPVQKLIHKQEVSSGAEETAGVGTGRTESPQLKTGRQSDSDGRRKSAAKEDPSPRASDSERNKDREAPGRVGSKPREGRLDKKAPLQEAPNVTGNKENEMEDRQQQQLEAASPAGQAAAESLPRTPKTPSKTSSLAKQAAEMLHNVQGHTPPSDPPAHTRDESSPLPRTPGRQKKGPDGDGTPKHLLLPPHPAEVPSCSPASEAGSEISDSMAAHTLIILSRATMPRTGSPLKDSLRQDGVADKSPSSSRNPRKRRLSSADTPPAKKDPRVSGTHTFALFYRLVLLVSAGL